MGKSKILKIIEFTLLNNDIREKYAIEANYAIEVYSPKKITILPCTPSFIIGIMNFRGKILSVIDIRNFLGLSANKISENDVKEVIVVKLEEIEVAISVNSILGYNNIFPYDIQKNLFTITNNKNSYFKGITNKGSIILDIKSIMMDEKIIINEEIV